MKPEKQVASRTNRPTGVLLHPFLLETGDRVSVRLVSGEVYTGLIDDATKDGNLVWVAATGIHHRKMFHYEGPDQIWAHE